LAAGRVSVTFDDGLDTAYWLALPEMERYGLVGSVFVITDLIGARYLRHPVMTEQMLLDLSSKGWEIGSHTKTHPRLTRVSYQRLNDELALSKRRLEQIVKKPVVSLAYPYGAFNSEVMQYAARHYVCARTSSRYPPLRLNSADGTDTMQLKAIDCVEPGYTLPVHLFYTHLASTARDAILGFVYRQGAERHRIAELVTRPSNLSARIVKKWIKKSSKNAWLILCFHHVKSNAAVPPYEIRLADFRQIIRTIALESSVTTIGRECATQGTGHVFC
jgi:peptidoglycan/xylan/chitin deacetylase (PgdA/CDA1 family)